MNAPRSRNEDIKEASRFLRGTIEGGLAEAVTGAIGEDDAQLTKFHGTYLQDDRDLRPERRRKKLEQAYAFMVRVRVPGGVCTPAQWLALDRIADDFGNGTLRLTTRQAFQFHGVIKSNLKRTMQGDPRGAPGHGRGLRRRQPQRHVQPEPAPLQGARGCARAGARDQRSPDAAHRRLSRDLARRREGGRHPDRGGADLRPPLPAAEVQDRGRGAALATTSTCSPRIWASSRSPTRRATWSATTSPSAAAWA